MSRLIRAANPIRLLVLARHAESSMSAAHVVTIDPSRPVGVSPRGRRQALRLGERIRNLEIELAVHTPLRRTRETVQLGLAPSNLELAGGGLR